MSHTKTRMEEAWTIEEVAFNELVQSFLLALCLSSPGDPQLDAQGFEHFFEMGSPHTCRVDELPTPVAEDLSGCAMCVHGQVGGQQGGLCAFGEEETQPYRILGACAPALAKRVMDADPEAGALLPCNIIVRAISPQRTGITFMDPEAIFGLSDSETVIAAGREARVLIGRVRDRLTGTHPIDLTAG